MTITGMHSLERRVHIICDHPDVLVYLMVGVVVVHVIILFGCIAADNAERWYPGWAEARDCGSKRALSWPNPLLPSQKPLRITT
jgi:hypothetical protein